MKARVTVATERDCRELAESLREEDRREVASATGEEPLPVLLHSLGGMAFTASDAEGVILMFGTYPSGVPGVGLVWLLGTPRIVARRREFLRLSRPFIDLMHRQYPLLVNFADARNAVHLRWLKWCGFKVVRTVLSTIDGTPFHEIAKLKCVPQQPS